MAQFRKSENPAQGFLLPPSPRDWLSPGHLAWFIQDAVAELDIDNLIDAYRVSGKGELPYPPRVMLQLLIYAYCTGTFSSRKMIRLEPTTTSRRGRPSETCPVL